ncbi:MAG: hypothetical protein KDA96_17815, partial [Planctomycetaceae bacterium]|nr:hypothetical protein [Planctomycetaceae bacterium]
ADQPRNQAEPDTVVRSPRSMSLRQSDNAAVAATLLLRSLCSYDHCVPAGLCASRSGAGGMAVTVRQQ